MPSLDFLTKLYKTSKSAVMIINTTNTICWSTNLFKIGLTEEDMRGKDSPKYFGKHICELYPGEYLAKINGSSYTYNVKTFADRTNEFVIVEIRTVTLGTSVIEDDAVCDLLDENQDIIKTNTSNILSAIDIMQIDKKNNTDNYNKILQYAKNIMNSNRPLFNLIETRRECDEELLEISISEIVQKVTDTINAFFNLKKVDVVINCTEDVYCKMGNIAFENLCLACLGRLMCICDGYIDSLTIGLEMTTSSSAELYLCAESPSGKVRISNIDELKQQLEKENTMGTDLFFIKYFCEKFSAEATQKIERDIHRTTISVVLPYCYAIDIILFKRNETLPKDYAMFSKSSLCVEKLASYIDENSDDKN